jgi:NAD(P)H-flavin reductase
MTPTLLSMPAAAASPWLPRLAVIAEIRPETPGVSTYLLRAAGDAPARAYDFLPGQFNMLYLPGFGEAAISMSGAPPRQASGESRPGWIHTIRQAGQVTGALARMKVGDALAVRGPYGKPWPLEVCRGSDVVIMAGGIGLAPLRPAIYQLLAERDQWGRLVLLYGARTAEGLLYRQEYEIWQHGGIELSVTVDRATAGWNGSVGVVPLLLDRTTLQRPGKTVVFSCGPEVMMRYAAVAALERGIPGDGIWVSLERHMQCAVGLCGHCQLGTTLVCRDGPVFRWDQVQPLLTIHDL